MNGMVIKSLKNALSKEKGMTLPDECITCVYNGLPEKKHDTFIIENVDKVIVRNNFETLCEKADKNHLFLFGCSNLVIFTMIHA